MVKKFIPRNRTRHDRNNRQPKPTSIMVHKRQQNALQQTHETIHHMASKLTPNNPNYE